MVRERAELGERFCEAVEAARGAFDPDLPGLEPRLNEAWQRAHDAVEHVDIDPGDFAHHLGSIYARKERRASATEWLAELEIADVYLACACVRGDGAAVERFDEQYSSLLLSIARRFPNSEHPPEDLVQSLHEQLLVGGVKQAPRLHRYAGRGALASWLRVTATRYFIDLQRTGSQTTYDATNFDDKLLAELPTDGADHELRLLKETYRAEFKDAFQQAFESLTSDQRNLLRQRVVGELGVHQLGELYGVHGSTISRRLSAIHDRLSRRTLELLEQSLTVESAEVDSIMRLINSQLDVSLSRLLRKPVDNEREPEP